MPTLCRLSEDARTDAASAARSFCLETIRQTYAIDYHREWHADLDSLPLPDAGNWFSAANRGAFYVVRDDGGAIVAAGGLYDLARKPATATRLGHGVDGTVCQIVRVYLDPAVRRQGLGRRIVALLEADAKDFGYRTAYLHADAEAAGTLAFWRQCGYREFGRFSYPTDRGTDTSVDFDKPLAIGPQ